MPKRKYPDMKFRYIVTLCALCVLCLCIIQPALAATGQDNATDYYNIAELAIGAGQYDKAVEYFDLALAENTTLIASGDALMYIYKDKAGALTDLGRYDEALKTVDAGLIQFKNNSGLWNNKGYVLYKMGRYSDAVDAYDHAVSIDPSYVKGWINKGNALIGAGRYQDAADAYNKALTLDPGNKDATDGIALAQKGAAAPPVTSIVLVIVLVIAAGAAVWYVKFRKPETKEQAENKSRENKK
jgi:tetratricopeptide (TPR) repeat protein